MARTLQDRSYLVNTRTDDDPGQDERGTFLYYLFYKVILPGVTVAAAANAMGARAVRTFRPIGSPLRAAFETRPSLNASLNASLKALPAAR